MTDLTPDTHDRANPADPPALAAALHRDMARHNWHEHYTELVERYPADDLRCAYHQHGHGCQHSYHDHSEPHTMADCPFKDTNRVRHVSVGPDAT